MFHLFDKVYLDLHHRVNVAQERIVISDTIGIPLAEQIETVHPGKLLMVEKSFDAVYPYKLAQVLKPLKESGRKVVIYLDAPSYKAFLAVWYATLFPEIDYDFFKHLMHTEAVRLQIRADFHDGNNPNPTEFVLTEEEVKALHEKYVSAVDKVKLRPFVKANFQSLSLEWHIFDYLKKQDVSNSALRSLVPLFVNRFFAEIVQEYRRFLLYNTYSMVQQNTEKFTCDCVAFDADPLKHVKSFPVLVSDAVKGTKDLSELPSDQLDDLLKELRTLSEDYIGYKPERNDRLFACWPLVGKVASEITNADVLLYLQTLGLSRLDNINIPSDDLVNINLVTIHYLLSITTDETQSHAFVND